MQSTFAGIEMGKRSLITHTKALTTVGHNLSNANVDTYSRQRVKLGTMDPLYMPGLNRAETAGQIGQGVQAIEVERIHDEMLQGRILSQASGEGYWDERNNYIKQLEQVYKEPSDLSVRSLMDKFWEGWQELSLHPSEASARRAVIERGKALSTAIRGRFDDLKEIRDMADEDVQSQVDRLNAIMQDITKLNDKILRVEAQGDNPNDLLDRRDAKLGEMSEIIEISVSNRDPDEFTVYTGGRHLIQGNKAQKLATQVNPDNEGYTNVVWEKSGDDFQARGGRLGALIELRDGDIRDEMQKLDMLAVNFTDMVNEIHREAYGTDGTSGKDFFARYPFINNTSGNFDRNGDGEFDSSYIFRIKGTNNLQKKEQVGLEGTITLSGSQGNTQVQYNSEDTVEEIVKRINTSQSEVVARLDRQGRLVLKGTPSENTDNPDFVIRRVEDSGEFLTGYAGLLQGSGPDNAYNWQQENAVNALQGTEQNYTVAPLSHPAGWMEVNSEVSENISNVAAGLGQAGREAKAGDGSAAKEIASLRHEAVMVGQSASFDDLFSETVANIGLKGEQASRALETEEAIMKDLTDMRKSVSGVNTDEEVSNMIKFQHGYNAAARFVSEVNKMLDTIINRMGV